MRLTYSRRALSQIEQISAYIARDNPTAAAAVLARIESLGALVSRYPSIGRPTDVADIRVISVRPYPYVLFYKALPDRNEVRILRVTHTARRRP